MSDEEQIQKLLETYKAAVSTKDVDAFVGLFDTNVRIFDMWGRWAYAGAGEWRGVVAQWFGSLGSERVAVEFDDLHTTVGDGIAAVNAFVTFKGLSAEGKELRAMNNRLTWVLRKRPEGSWKVVHEHTSAPIDFETSKAMLRR